MNILGKKEWEPKMIFLLPSLKIALKAIVLISFGEKSHLALVL